MLKPFFFFILVFAAGPLQAQKNLQEKGWSASLTGAIIPLPEFNVGIQPGAEYRFNDRVSLLTEFTIRVGNKADKDSEAINKKYFRVQQELRYRFSFKKQKRNKPGAGFNLGREMNTYAGFRYSYSTRKFDDINQGFYATDRGDEGYFYDKAQISSPVITTSLQLGRLFSLGKKMSLDVFTGMGARFVHTTYSNVENPRKGVRTRPLDGPTFYASYSYAGNLAWFHLNAGFRFLYRFG